MSDLLEVTARSVTGSKACQKLRQEGHVPAVLYGHGEACIDLVVSRDAVEAMVRHGSKTVELTGAVKSPALIRELSGMHTAPSPCMLIFCGLIHLRKLMLWSQLSSAGNAQGQRLAESSNR